MQQGLNSRANFRPSKSCLHGGLLLPPAIVSGLHCDGTTHKRAVIARVNGANGAVGPSWAGEASSRKPQHSGLTRREMAVSPANNTDISQLNSYDQFGTQVAMVKFHLKYRTAFGQAVKLLGSHPRLGNWKIENAVEMRWTTGDQWVANVQLPSGGVYEYKYVIIDYETKQPIEWQSGSNAVLAVVVSETEVDVFDNWGNNPGAMVKVDNDTMTRESKLLRWSNEMMEYWKEARRLQIELAQRGGEVSTSRNELASLRMELSLERQGRLQAEAKAMELQVENANLQNQLVQKTVELNNTLTEVLSLLDREIEQEDEFEEQQFFEGSAVSRAAAWESTSSHDHNNGNSIWNGLGNGHDDDINSRHHSHEQEAPQLVFGMTAADRYATSSRNGLF